MPQQSKVLLAHVIESVDRPRVGRHAHQNRIPRLDDAGERCREAVAERMASAQPADRADQVLAESGLTVADWENMAASAGS